MKRRLHHHCNRALFHQYHLQGELLLLLYHQRDPSCYQTIDTGDYHPRMLDNSIDFYATIVTMQRFYSNDV